MTTPSVQAQRDNLSIGLFLARNPYGTPLDQVLISQLGYNPQGSYPSNSFDRFERRFRKAQATGRDRFRDRVPGYFVFNAMPFGQIWVYKVTWYTWVNSQTGTCQIVPIVTADLSAMRQFRDRDLETRGGSTRSVRAADDIERERRAIARQDFRALQAVQSQMLADGSLGEILSGLHGIPYADLQQILPQLPNRTFGNSMTLQFQRTAKKIRNLEQRLRREQAQISQQLFNWVMLQTGLPSNARQLALQDAAARLGTLGGP